MSFLPNRFYSQLHGSITTDFGSRVFQTYVTQMLVVGMSMAATIGVARALGPEGRGLYAVATAISLIGVQFSNFGFHGSNTYYLGQNPSLLPYLLGNSLFLSFALGGGCAALAGLLFLIRPMLAPVNGPLLALALASIPVGLAYLFTQNLLLALWRTRSFNVVDIVSRALMLILTILLIFSRLGIKPELFFASSVVGQLAGLGLALSLMHPLLPHFPRFSLKLMRDHFGLGFKAYLILFFSFLVLRLDLLMVKYMRGTEQTGYYSITASMADYILMLPTVVGMLLFSKLSAISGLNEKLRTAKRAAYGTALAMLPLLVIGAFAAKYAVRIMFGRSYLPAADAFLWLLPGIFSLSVEIVIVQFLNSIGYPRIIVWIWFLSTVVNVLLNLWTIPHFGISGASAVSSISYTLTLIAVLAIIQRRQGVISQVHDVSYA